MKAQELRIGNYVQELVLNTTCKVRGIGDGLIWLNGKLKMIESVIEPIPLTEEWLLKFGFEKENGSCFKNLNESDYYLDWDSPTGLYLIDQDDQNQTFDLSHVEHVHQLQNLYFALTGEELTIKP